MKRVDAVATGATVDERHDEETDEKIDRREKCRQREDSESQTQYPKTEGHHLLMPVGMKEERDKVDPNQ